jgi:DNA-binding NarL/FixJ family response regulator
MKRTKSRDSDARAVWFSGDAYGRLEELRDQRGKASVDTVVQEAIDLYAGFPNRNEIQLFLKLAPRLQEVLRMIAEGMSTKEIAARLGISKKTVEFHRRRLARQLGIHTVALLARFAVRAGAVPL